MLVIATSIPDEREWIQWRGRTARQDRPGQVTAHARRLAPPNRANRPAASASACLAACLPACVLPCTSARLRACTRATH
eukprot:4983232-Prymnesium_polylepis.1